MQDKMGMTFLIPLGLVLVLSILVPVTLMEKDVCPCSYGVPGLPGIPGITGKDGRDGLKGAKGERGTPAISGTHGVKGEKGDRGIKGASGKNGPMGPPGTEGDKGSHGQTGEVGQSGNHKHMYQSAFTVARLTADYPTKNTRALFTKEISNKMKDYDTETGAFTCRIPGLYYFTFHATQTYNLCIVMYRDGARMASFCEHMSNKAQVTSGGVLLALKKDQQVWLEVNDYNGLFAGAGEDSVFTGFLLFPD